MGDLGSIPTTRGLGAFVEGLGAVVKGPVKRWDGAARTCCSWDELRRDPELWYRNGNCLVHLYGKGQSKRGPSFKIPFKDLVMKKCYPLIERFLAPPGVNVTNLRQLERWSRLNPDQLIELYIPAPAMADKSQAFAYHVATRNFFAWVFQKSMVGEHLGTALVGLLHSMHEFRAEGSSNVDELISYLDEEGYLGFANQTNHALAILHLAETFEITDLYLKAFAHCAGMSDRLYTSEEYEVITMETKKLIRKARADMDSKLYTATEQLQTLLDEELSDAHMGMPSGTRAHMERFRSFLLSFYATRLGYYPPKAFDTQLLQSMRKDFECLVNLLADEAYTESDVIPSDALGGICTLQLLQSFDNTHGFETLKHPLPLLPDFKQNVPNRFSWLTRSDKLRPNQRLLAHTALIKASNWTESIFHNDIVKAYRQFEEQLVMKAKKGDKQEKVTLVEARKVRWILVYAVYQVLRSVTDVPPELRDATNAPYPMLVSLQDLPPWQEMKPIDRILRRQTEFVLENSSGGQLLSPTTGLEPRLSRDSVRIEIKPDIDYLALSHQGEFSSHYSPNSPVIMVPPRSSSLSRALSRSSTIRRSMRRFRANSNPPTPPLGASSPRPCFHEIVVQGYGNGTNRVDTKSTRQTYDTQRWSPTSEGGADESSSQPESGFATPQTTDSDDTLDDSIKTPSPIIPLAEMHPPTPKPLRVGRRDVVSMFTNRSLSARSSRQSGRSDRRPMSSFFGGNDLPQDYSDAYQELVAEQRRSFFGGDCTPAHKDHPDIDEEPRIVDRDYWETMEAYLEEGGELSDSPRPASAYARPAWEQYANLGGLTEIK
ncbi:unnamed protein product [Clonostachys byssicola]|uniref:DUF8004 domain-containing protein n=1 Tax=Clonostachys byssicola TaxID=160290 RepID=A0A9N9UJG7_9HYPO|nr:unnamed protein product [Clonostachys byssicola]